MSDKTSLDLKVLFFHAVLTDPREFLPSKIVKTRNAEILGHLEKSRLLNFRRKGRSLYLSANDSTWRWVEEHLGDDLPHRQVCSGFLKTLRENLAKFIAHRGVRLSEVLAPAPLPDPSPAGQIRDACLNLSQGQYDVRVRLRDLRPALAALTRSQQDETLLAMQRDGLLTLFSNDDPRDRNSDDEAAAMIVGDRHRDLLYLHRERHQ